MVAMLFLSIFLDLRASKKHRQRSVLSSFLCCFGAKRSKPTKSSSSTGETIIQTSPADNTAAVLPQPNLNQNTLTQGYDQDEKEEEIESEVIIFFLDIC